MRTFLLSLLLLAGATAAQPVADFDGRLPAGIQVVNASARIDRQSPAAGQGALRLAPTDPEKMSAVWLPVQGVDPDKVAGVSIQLRAQAKEAPVRVRLLARDAQQRRIYQRAVKLPNDNGWQAIDLPLHQWRWGNVLAGWGEVREIGLVVETATDTVGVDEWKLVPQPAVRPVPWLMEVAFPDRGTARVGSDLLVMTDAVQDLKIEDLNRTYDHMRRARLLVKRLFGDAVRPVGEPAQPTLLIFADHGGMQRFWQRLGTQWAVDFEPPTSGGYTVQDIATSFYDRKLGPDRPVYLHEAVHAVVAHDLRLFTHDEKHWWLHEAVANYVQLCVYPKSLDENTLADGFEDGVGEKEFFLPLKTVMARRGGDQHYAQLATIAAFLAEKHADYLPVIARTLAEGGETAEALKQLGTDFAKLEAAWLAWGRERFEDPRPDHFAKPPEWK